MHTVELLLVVVAVVVVVVVYRDEDGLLGRAGAAGHGGRADRAGGIDRGRDTKGLSCMVQVER